MESGPRSCGGDGGPERAVVAEVGPSWPSIRGGKRAKAIQEEIGNSLPPHFLLLPSLLSAWGFLILMMVELTRTNSSFHFVNKLENIGEITLVCR